MTDAHETWDCGGDCIFGVLRGHERNCDTCWANCVVSLPEEQT